MLLEEMLRDERAEGRIEQAKSMLLSLLDIHGMKDYQILKEIDRIDNIQLLNELTIMVAKSTSTEEFLTAYKELMS